MEEIELSDELREHLQNLENQQEDMYQVCSKLSIAIVKSVLKTLIDKCPEEYLLEASIMVSHMLLKKVSDTIPEESLPDFISGIQNFILGTRAD